MQLLFAEAAAERGEGRGAGRIRIETAGDVVAGGPFEVIADLVVEIRVHARPPEQRDQAWGETTAHVATLHEYLWSQQKTPPSAPTSS